MKYTKQQLENMKDAGGNLYLRGTRITSLPDNLTVGGSLDLRDTRITSLPDNLTVGGSLDLSGTQITSLPDNLTVGGSLYLRGTQITSLPDNLTVGGSLDLRGTRISNPNNYKSLHDGEYQEGRYQYCDGILTHIKARKEIKGYVFYVGKIKGKNVVTDGTYYAHCRTFKEGVLDLEFKKSKNRGSEHYKHLKYDSVLTYEEAIIAYRIITGACKAGTQQFLDGLKEKKDKYTVAEIISATKGQFGSTVFEDFIKRNTES